MGNQIDMKEMLPTELMNSVRSFVDAEYLSRKTEENLPPIRTRYEAYGKLSEGMVNVLSAMDGVKAGMRDCLKSLTGSDVVFAQTAEQTYSSLLDALVATAEMAVQSLNAIYKMEDVIAAAPQPPLLEMAEEGEEEPAENIDDKTATEANNEEEEF